MADATGRPFLPAIAVTLVISSMATAQGGQDTDPVGVPAGLTTTFAPAREQVAGGSTRSAPSLPPPPPAPAPDEGDAIVVVGPRNATYVLVTGPRAANPGVVLSVAVASPYGVARIPIPRTVLTRDELDLMLVAVGGDSGGG